MTRAETKLRELLRHLYGCRSIGEMSDLDSREVIVTPFGGAYGVAGHVIALNGSPPRGVIVSMEGRDNGFWIPPAIFYLAQDKSKRLGQEGQSRTVRAFLSEYMQRNCWNVAGYKAEGPVTLDDGTKIGFEEACYRLEEWGGGPAGNVIRRFNSWIVTQYGVECLVHPYRIEKERLSETDWVAHVCEKTWVKPMEFCAAFEFAQKHFLKAGIETCMDVLEE